VLAKSSSFEVAETIIPPGLTTPLHSHSGPHLAVAITDADLTNRPQGKSPVEVHRKAGDIDWIPAGSRHTLTNSGKSEARIITIEFQH
jgi:quercetin dioxygenase-like cupin family protein